MILTQISGTCAHQCVRGEAVWELPHVMVSFTQWVAMMLLLQITVPGSWTMWKGKHQGRVRKTKRNPRTTFRIFFSSPYLFHNPFSLPFFLRSSASPSLAHEQVFNSIFPLLLSFHYLKASTIFPHDPQVHRIFLLRSFLK